MKDLSTKFLGIPIKTPIIAASCVLTSDYKMCADMEELGIGAIIVKSLFEEQITNEVKFIAENSVQYPEMEDYLHTYMKSFSIKTYMDKLEKIKFSTDIPIIASINCYSPGEWYDYAKQISELDIQGLEINLFDIPLTLNMSGEQVQQDYFTIVKKIVNEVNLPISVKMSSHFNNIPLFVSKLAGCGVKSVSLFNKFYTPDIDVDKLKITSPEPFSHKDDYLPVLRWIAIVSSLVKNIEISATTGIFSPETAVKQILAGANTVQLCSTLFKDGLKIIPSYMKYLETFMDKHGFDSINQFKGKLNYSNVKNPIQFERVQFMKTFNPAFPGWE
ncbi:MAG: dihydroorotate dehydrogenase-like protein [Bacteroidales bacterium]